MSSKVREKESPVRGKTGGGSFSRGGEGNQRERVSCAEVGKEEIML